MKGMVFTNFLEMVEEHFGFEIVDTIIDSSELPSKGAYTAVGTYPHTEMVALLQSLEKETNVPIAKLLVTYGSYLFAKLAEGYPMMLTDCNCSRDLLLRLDGVVHVEVAKLYPDAQLPRFETVELPNGDLEMTYLSERHLEDLAEGLLRGSLVHFKDKASITRHPKADGSVIFKVSYKGHEDS
ncbi:MULTISPECIES: heme NO-binding domain-containing protein [unclassified Lentimonas]|uniref:heme NO-binding domain-containing protein n=1 Tax=unclassified Lentimonas TaxID=2630993 RepID=UPI00132A3DF1|nr:MULTISPECIES: heme NO-binding domain-containing protein [unclassified Lentimonas]CAA6678239.1 Guanylate cyclase-related protein [Lentimonas sp. CC4]CAA6684865.1 Guanylate cyclase-related protein [Lentimonas sp. CC6]CAA7076780.1 Guanylate cyclase-related protein [Lentimonas sp. CC4]CAA7170822.1 Guanylate cyclase-related protein [Lentimonas sp. CC21]CAA7179615.1 Guanylate cyclase-related protein [Lentimonas sp. CC8]